MNAIGNDTSISLFKRVVDRLMREIFVDKLVDKQLTCVQMIFLCERICFSVSSHLNSHYTNNDVTIHTQSSEQTRLVDAINFMSCFVLPDRVKFSLQLRFPLFTKFLRQFQIYKISSAVNSQLLK